MVRSIEDCRSGVDALKEQFKHLTKVNESESVLAEWYTEPFLSEEFIHYVPEKDLQLWIRNHKKIISTSIKEALVEGMGNLLLTQQFVNMYQNCDSANTT